jgi:hypothetical protein
MPSKNLRRSAERKKSAPAVRGAESNDELSAIKLAPRNSFSSREKCLNGECLKGLKLRFFGHPAWMPSERQFWFLLRAVKKRGRDETE